MNMTRNDPDASRAPLRARVRAAGGWYAYLNAALIRVAGPAAVGPYDADEGAAAPAPRPCPVCGGAMAEHTFERSGPKPLMTCPR